MRDKARVVVRREIPSLRGKNIWTRSKLLDLGVTRERVSYSRHMVMREDDFLLLHFSPADWQLHWLSHICLLFAVHLTRAVAHRVWHPRGNGAEKRRNLHVGEREKKATNERYRRKDFISKIKPASLFSETTTSFNATSGECFFSSFIAATVEVHQLTATTEFICLSLFKALFRSFQRAFIFGSGKKSRFVV